MSDLTARIQWLFSAVSPGLIVSSDVAKGTLRSTVSKPAANNELFDADGHPLSAAAAGEATTWRSHHAFSARCQGTTASGEAPSPCVVDRAEDTEAWQQTMDAWRATYRAWEARFYLSATSTDSQPNMLLSVAPLYFPYVTGTNSQGASTSAAPPLMPSSEDQHRYDARLLHTPLIWEEPLALSVECSSRGLFLWSDHWEHYGVKLSERCFTRCSTAQPTSGNSTEGSVVDAHRYHAAVRLRWQMVDSTPPDRNGPAEGVLSVALGALPSDVAGTTHGSSDVTHWEDVAQRRVPLSGLAKDAVFLPYVTLMEKHDTVTVL